MVVASSLMLSQSDSASQFVHQKSVRCMHDHSPFLSACERSKGVVPVEGHHSAKTGPDPEFSPG